MADKLRIILNIRNETEIGDKYTEIFPPSLDTLILRT